MAAELQQIIQNADGSFQSDLMKKFVAKYRSENLPPVPNQNVGKGASIFSAATTTTTTTTGTGAVTDNANILQQKNIADNRPNANTNATTTTTTTTTTSPHILQNQNQEDNGNGNGNLNANVNRNANHGRTTTTTKTASPSACPDQPDSNANKSEVNAVLEEVRGAMNETRLLLVQQVTEATVDAHLATCINTHKAVAEATARFMAMKASGQLPDMSKLSLSSGSMWEKMMDQMKPELAKTMQFCKMLPGFSDLRPDDQMKLIKQGTFEVMLTRFSMLINHEKETMLDPSHKMICPRQVVKEMPMGKFLDGFFHVGAQFNPIGLTDGEIALFTAVLVFSPSRSELSDTRLISTIQSLYQQALFSLLKRNHSDPEDKFTKVLSLVPMFRRMNEEHTKALGAMQMKSPDAYNKQFPPLHKEMYAPGSQ